MTEMPVPTISQFLGITIRMYYRDHEEAHFHAFYGDAEASIRLRDHAVVAGALPARVLGLVAEPPAPQFVHRPDAREQARIDGLKVAEQYNCGGCHALQMDRWDVRYKPG